MEWADHKVLQKETIPSFSKTIWVQKVRKSRSLGCALAFWRIKMMLELKLQLSGEKCRIKTRFLRDQQLHENLIEEFYRNAPRLLLEKWNCGWTTQEESEFPCGCLRRILANIYFPKQVFCLILKGKKKKKKILFSFELTAF